MLPAKMSLMLTLVEALSVLLVLSFQVFQVYVYHTHQGISCAIFLYLLLQTMIDTSRKRIHLEALTGVERLKRGRFVSLETDNVLLNCVHTVSQKLTAM